MLYLLKYITENIQVTEGHKYFRRRPKVGQPWFRIWHISRVVLLFHDSSSVECSKQNALGKEMEKLHFCILLNEEQINGRNRLRVFGIYQVSRLQADPSGRAV
jgi:hypothetical protein